MENSIQKFVLALVDKDVSTKKQFLTLQRDFARGTDKAFFMNDQLLQEYHKLVSNKIIQPSSKIEKLLQLKSTRSNSGIVVVSILTKPFPCPGKCIYCPSIDNVPKSYLPNEPAVKRAIMCRYDPYEQVSLRLKALESVGHSTDKVNIRIIGGTWSYYPRQYQNWFIRRVFEACNAPVIAGSGLKPESHEILKQVQDDDRKTMEILQKSNESAQHRIVEISVETRQDYININEIKRLRNLGVTKVELGVQSVDEKVLRLNNRGNTSSETIEATKMLKDAGFKVSYQMMTNLYGSDYEKDLETFQQLFRNPDYKPDHLKIYPLALVKESELYQKYLEGKFQPYDEKVLTSLLVEIKKLIPRYCRIERMIRDIPAESIVAGGAKISNLRQIVDNLMSQRGLKCQCIRCREVKSDFDPYEKYKLFREDFAASSGKEIFLTIESLDQKKLYSMLRLRISNASNINVLKNSALVREIHTYGPMVKIGAKNSNAPQHRGFGKLLVEEAEKIAKDEFGLKRIAVIAGVGVRPYFRKLGYDLKETYMVKRLSNKN